MITISDKHEHLKETLAQIKIFNKWENELDHFTVTNIWQIKKFKFK